MAYASQFKSTPMMRVLAAGVESNTPVVLKGDPGEGKTATIENAAAQWGRHCETIVGSSREATDYLGVMVENDNETIGYRPFQWVANLNDAPSRGLRGLLFLDELNRAAPMTMNAMLRVLQERHVGDTPLGDHVSIVAAANPEETNPEVEVLSSAAANRLMHLDWQFDAQSWMDNLASNFQAVQYDDLTALTHKNPNARMAVVGAEIAGFHNHDRTMLRPGVPQDPTQASGAWASPRSWHNLARVAAHLQKGDDEALALAATSLVGKGAAKSFLVWRATADLIDPAEVLRDPGAVDWRNTRPDRLFVLVNSVGAIGLTDKKYWTPAVEVMAACAAGGKPDVAMPSVTRLLNHRPEGTAALPSGVREHFGELLNRTTRGVRAAA